jgi:catechol 2,3-dioxygenase-like lactoylglutathione lyase family enzyme
MKRFMALFAFVATATAQTQVLGVGNFIHVVADLDKSMAFYRDSMGLEMTGAPGPRAFSANAVVSSLYDAPGAQSRVASFKIPGSEMAVEMVEFQGVSSTPVRRRLSDVGAITLTLFVKDFAAAGARLKGADVVNSGAGEMVVRDPDGIYVRVKQADSASAGFGITVADLAKTLKFYRDVLGFEVRAGNANILMVPGSAFPVEFTESKGGSPARAAIHDPGAGVLRLRVKDVDAVMGALKAAGAPVVSTGGAAVDLGRGRAVIFREMNGVFLQALQ